MKVQLVVVRGKPEGKVIPLTAPKFKIGRGETCNLRPISEQISREHAEFELQGETLTVRDLGSRNGTLVNGKALTSGPCTLHDRDLVQVGPLTFAVAIQQTKPAAKPSAAPAASKPASAPSPDDISTDDIDSWLLGERGVEPDQATAVYGGDTITIAAFKDAQAPAPPAKPAAPQPNKPPSVADDSEYERQTEEEEEEQEEEEEIAASGGDDESEEAEEEAEESGPEEEFMDPSNPFYAAKKAQKEKEGAKPSAGQAGAANQQFKDSSDAANEILRKLMERRRASKS
ncbi:Glycogen accumulation regulator GarA [Aquisphaera giovannonii]|uniref:Glycogen accumulation regulator GarA n=1 Tax=Aquisphaera giovannonii TaxID=406548 RepID=A0A5B9WBD6_9BACT|nr:FHA domain-containing protein [Aquisphaera giovannonii]QEH37988.1 Glycogen accumulation regulator GarA [Aquisphaera giovannonii]